MPPRVLHVREGCPVSYTGHSVLFISADNLEAVVDTIKDDIQEIIIQDCAVGGWVRLMCLIPKFINVQTVYMENVSDAFTLNTQSWRCEKITVDSAIFGFRIRVEQNFAVKHLDVCDEVCVMGDFPPQLETVSFALSGNFTIPQTTRLRKASVRGAFKLGIPRLTTGGIEFEIAPTVEIFFYGKGHAGHNTQFHLL